MAHIEDRWTTPGPNGRRVKSARHGRGKRWLAVWHEADGTRRKKACATKDEAQAHLDHVAAQRATGTYISRGRGSITVAQMAEEWVDAHPDWAQGTRERNLDILRVHVLPAWGSTRLEDITEGGVQAWVNRLPGSPAGVRRIHQVLSGILSVAVRRKRLPANPAAGVRFPEPGAPRQHALAVPELDTFIAAHPPHWRTWARLLALTGVRVSEAAGLKVRDVDVPRRRFQVRDAVVVVNGRKIHQTGRVKSRTSQGRWVPLIGTLADDVAALLEGKRPDDFVFTTPGGASVNRANYSRRIFRAAAQEIGRPELRPHDLRHTAVTLAIRAGASVKVIQAIAGHKDASMTLNVYAHLFDADLEVVSDQVAALLDRERTEPPGSPQHPSAGR